VDERADMGSAPTMATLCARFSHSIVACADLDPNPAARIQSASVMSAGFGHGDLK
jgi:hypothetical protein